ncbi:oligosaccharide flippase family protein [Mycobacterium sp. 155]|uniref:oligosaccharide flippase family protein n=1 Tax=Mycobacterium sp. 155 TaxID=1157943 RepID=UPI0003727A65|nr:oligosaccharide flippase family protein [Mycobacterium sp. 155]
MGKESGPSADADDPAVAAPGQLGGVVRRGALTSAITLAFVQAASLVSTLILARLLTPEQVGVFAAATLLTTVLASISEGSLRLALIQRERDVDDAADTVFWSTAIGGLLMSVVAAVAAPVLGHFFHNDLVTAVALATSGLLFLQSLINVPDGLMQRGFNFLRRLVIDPSRALAYGAVAIPLAAYGFGVWSMVLGQYAAVLVWLVGSWSLARWRPGRGRPSWRLWRELARFAFPLLVQDIVLYIREMAQTAITGRRFGEATLGSYRYGSRIGLLPGLAVVEIGAYVLFPAFSRMAGDHARLRHAFLRALRWIWFAAAPVAVLVVTLGEQTVIVLLGEPWREAGMFLAALAGYGLGIALQAVASEAIKAAGRPALFHWTSALELVLGVGLVIALVPFGLVGVGIAISVTELAIGGVLLVLAKPIVGYRFTTLLRILAPASLAAGVALITAVFLRGTVASPVGMPTLAALGVLAAQATLLVLCYLLILALVDFRMALRLITAIRARF